MLKEEVYDKWQFFGCCLSFYPTSRKKDKNLIKDQPLFLSPKYPKICTTKPENGCFNTKKRTNVRIFDSPKGNYFSINQIITKPCQSKEAIKPTIRTS